jgi:hypothetical protein
VPADEAADLVDAHRVEAVPTCVLLQHGAEVGRVAGADAAQLAQRVQQALARPATPAPGAAPAAVLASAPPTAKVAAPPVELTTAVRARLEGLVKSARCVAFIKGTPAEPRCGFTRQLVQLLATHHVDYQSYNILADEEARQGEGKRARRTGGCTDLL